MKNPFRDCMMEDCNRQVTMLIHYNGVTNSLCDPCCQSYLSSTECFDTIEKIERVAPCDKATMNEKFRKWGWDEETA